MTLVFKLAQHLGSEFIIALVETGRGTLETRLDLVGVEVLERLAPVGLQQRIAELFDSVEPVPRLFRQTLVHHLAYSVLDVRIQVRNRGRSAVQDRLN